MLLTKYNYFAQRYFLLIVLVITFLGYILNRKIPKSIDNYIIFQY